MTTFSAITADTLKMLPRLLTIAALVATTAFAVSKVNAAPEAVVTDVMLVGGQLTKPSGVGFVLAVGLQRLR